MCEAQRKLGTTAEKDLPEIHFDKTGKEIMKTLFEMAKADPGVPKKELLQLMTGSLMKLSTLLGLNALTDPLLKEGTEEALSSVKEAIRKNLEAVLGKAFDPAFLPDSLR